MSCEHAKNCGDCFSTTFVDELEADRDALEEQNKSLRARLEAAERVVDAARELAFCSIGLFDGPAVDRCGDLREALSAYDAPPMMPGYVNPASKETLDDARKQFYERLSKDELVARLVQAERDLEALQAVIRERQP